MPKVVPAEELDLVLTAVARYPEGIGVEQLHRAQPTSYITCTKAISRYSLRLSEFKEWQHTRR